MGDFQINSWWTHHSREVYENDWILVREDAVTRPDGNPGIYGVVHFKNRAIGIVPVDDEGRIHLVGQYRYPLNRYSWEIPEGGCPNDEKPLAAAQRELLEETGLVAKEWRLLGTAHLSNSITDEEAFCFLATGLTQRAARPEGTRINSSRWTRRWRWWSRERSRTPSPLSASCATCVPSSPRR